jgi:HME family heavy-metal exporter
VVEGPEIKRGDASVDGAPGVVITVVKQPHADTRALTAEVHAALRELEPTFPKDVVVNHELFQLKTFIDRGVYNVGEALVVGAGLVLVILALFLMNFRTTFISLTAIPLSLAVTVIVFKVVGRLTGVELSINVMTLGGIAVAMGELVDDAIVDVENIYRRLRENNASSNPRHPLRVVYEASREIRSAIVFGTLVVILVFLPLFALSGVEGRLFAPLGLAYITSILASLLVSLTVTPVASYYLLANARVVHTHGDGPLLRLLKAMARPIIRLSMAHPWKLLLLTWVGVALAGWQVTRLGADFLPPFDEGSVQVNVTLPAGCDRDGVPHQHQPGLGALPGGDAQAHPGRPEGGRPRGRRGGRAAARAPDLAHGLRGLRPDRHQDLRGRPGRPAEGGGAGEGGDLRRAGGDHTRHRVAEVHPRGPRPPAARRPRVPRADPGGGGDRPEDGVAG